MDTSFTKRTDKYNELDLFLFMGQSNMAGRGVAAEAPIVPSGHGYEFRAITDSTKLYDIVEPFGANENVTGGINDVNNRKTGTLISAFANAYYNQTKVPVVGISASEGGTRIREWQPGTGRCNDAVRRYKACIEYLNTQDYCIRNKFMVWCQGETDADEGVTKEQYMDAFKSLAEYWVELGIDMIFIIQIGNNRDNLTLYKELQEAQAEIGRTYDKCLLVSSKFAEMSAIGLMKDAYHYKQEAYNIIGTDAGRNAGYYTTIPKQVSAVYGSPIVDGDIDECWSKAEIIVPKLYGAAAEVSAEHRVMWDENALYIMSVVKKRILDKSNPVSYQQDSVELFLDERNDRANAYQSDDVHYRVNFDNERSYDSGERNRFYSKTQRTKDSNGAIDGYIVEACIIWDEAITPENGIELGIELMINEASNGKRNTTIAVFDTTGNAFQNPSLFGRLVLTGKPENTRKRTNPYSLLAYIDNVKDIYLDAYVNKDSIIIPLTDAERIASDTNATQDRIDHAYQVLKAAVDNLIDGSGFLKPSALPMEHELPDAFTFLDGSKVNNHEQWKLRQDEISRMYQYYMYGVVRDRSEESITTEYVDTYKTWNWWGQELTMERMPNQRFVQINIAKDSKIVNFVAAITFPSETVKNPETEEEEIHILSATRSNGYPVLIVIGSLGTVEKRYLNEHGYVVIEYSNTVIASDNSSFQGIFYELYPYGKKWTEQTGVLLAWTWGVSKIIDMLELDAAGANELNISPVNTIVTGVSRNGKAAAVAGAFDPRVKVTAPACSGEGGMASFRYTSAGKQYDYSMLELHELTDQLGIENGTSTWQGYQDSLYHTVGSNEALSNIQSAGEAHWFNDNFRGFTSPYQLPFDQHFLAALCAEKERYFFITGEVIGGDWTNPAAMYVSYLAAQKIYDCLGLSDNIGIHIHAVGHAFTLEDTKYLVEFCNRKFYGITDGIMDLGQLKTSIYEDKRNYDSYLDKIKKMQGTEL